MPEFANLLAHVAASAVQPVDRHSAGCMERRAWSDGESEPACRHGHAHVVAVVGRSFGPILPGPSEGAATRGHRVSDSQPCTCLLKLDELKEKVVASSGCGCAGKSPNLLEITPADASDRSIEIHKMRWERPYKRVGSQRISPAKYGVTSLSFSPSLSLSVAPNEP